MGCSNGAPSQQESPPATTGGSQHRGPVYRAKIKEQMRAKVQKNISRPGGPLSEDSKEKRQGLDDLQYLPQLSRQEYIVKL
eukprot:Skav227453  [mRNA]  locus=scaffold2491:151289:151531:+ [translate_table: standard]